MNRKLNPKINTIRFFFPLKSRYFFLFSKKGRGGLPLPFPLSFTPVSMAEYAPIFLNILKYCSKCLNKLFWLCQSSEYTWSFCMFHRLLKTWQVWKCARVLWIWCHCICKGYSFFWICVNMAPNMPQQCLNMHCPLTMFLNMPGNAWINCSVLTMPGFSICLITLDIRQGFVNATGIKYTDSPDLRY